MRGRDRGRPHRQPCSRRVERCAQLVRQEVEVERCEAGGLVIEHLVTDRDWDWDGDILRIRVRGRV